jgi:cyclophilin family peptidyl-prolyl cis-trans isomerase
MGIAPSARADGPPGIEARLSVSTRNIYPGQPVRVEFVLRNLTDQQIVLSAPNVSTEASTGIAELPLAHVFSGPSGGGLTVRAESERTWTEPVSYHPPAAAPEIVLGPHAIVGTVVDLTQYFTALRNAGLYRLTWQPYGGAVTSNTLTLDIAPLKQATIATDHGDLTVQFLYDLAPNHVQNFIELARSGFYNQKSFHRIVPGFFLQGGDPMGTGQGIRLDGKKVAAEFNSHPFTRGTLAMALVEGDPNSASCQFIICNTRMPEWDGKYTAFAQTVGEESLRTLDRLMATEVDENDRPLKPVVIRGVRISDAPQSTTSVNLAPPTTPSR